LNSDSEKTVNTQEVTNPLEYKERDVLLATDLQRQEMEHLERYDSLLATLLSGQRVNEELLRINDLDCDSFENRTRGSNTSLLAAAGASILRTPR
jgi:DNA-directed RNA polymerase subunit F